MSFTKQGKTSVGTVVFISIATALSLLIVAGSVSLMFVFFRYVRPAATVNRVANTSQTVTEELEPVTNSNETVSGTSDKHFSIADAALLPDDGSKEALSVVDIVKAVSPATISIRTQLTFEAYGETATAEATGSGFIITEDGYIVTNSHVIEDADKVEVMIPGDDEYIDAEIVGSDSSTDMAVLKVDRSGLPFVTLGDSSKLQVGELAVAIGNPFGELAGTVTVGVISALDREITIGGSDYYLLQTDASINSGNSGGPLVNSYGEVIGITNAKVSEGEGIGFAIPVNSIKEVIEELVMNGYVTGRPLIGVSVVTVDEETADAYGFPIGAFVREVSEGGAADEAGIRYGDIIIAIDGETITTADEVAAIRNSFDVGDEVIFTIYRDSEEIELTVVLQEAKS